MVGPETTVEWYTPPPIIEAARKVMGSIDCGPATSEGNHTGAKIFYTMETEGLDEEWIGNVWLNPPFGKRPSHVDVQTHSGVSQRTGKSSHLLSASVDKRQMVSLSLRIRSKFVFTSDHQLC